MKTNRMAALGAVMCMLAGSVAGQSDGLDERMSRMEAELEALRAEVSTESSRKGVEFWGYGELHCNNLEGEGGAPDKNEIDFHRFVLGVAYEFSDRIRFGSELEVEHAVSGDDQPGEVELEQAYIDFDLNDRHTVRGGLFLIPVGLINDNHEPTRFYGVERNPVENRILPTTWWEAGAGMYGKLAEAWRYDAYLHSGLAVSSGAQYAVRSGRQKVAKANASDPAATVALTWARPGLSIGGSAQYQTDAAQGEDPEVGEAVLGEIHSDAQLGDFRIRLLYAEWYLAGEGPASVGADRQYGWYIEPSYRVLDVLGLFVRYSDWDNQAGKNSESGKQQWDTGVNYWPHPQVVVKADYQWQQNDNGQDQNGFNLGLGYDF